jgi:hypothetical protein
VPKWRLAGVSSDLLIIDCTKLRSVAWSFSPLAINVIIA